MKNYIKYIAVLLLTGLALVSCNDDFDEGDNNTSYPAALETGTWAREYTAEGSVHYTLNFMEGEDGDLLCDVTYYNAANGNVNVFSAGEVSYDPVTGQAEIYYENSLYNSPAVIYFTFQTGWQRATVTVYALNDGKLAKKDNFAVAKAAVPSVYGQWSGAAFSLTLNPDGTASFEEGGTTVGGTYSFSGSTGTVTLDDGTQVELAFNSKGQLVASRGGSSEVVSHDFVELADDWAPYAKGIYSSWWNNASYELTMEYSVNQQCFRIYDFAEPGSVMSAYWDGSSSVVTPAEDMFYSGYDHSAGSVYAVPTAITSDGATMVYEDGVFYFGFSWDVPGAGTFGAAMDTFTITEKL